MTGAEAHPATAEGVLARTPFPHLLVYMADRLLSGSLRLVSAAGDGQPLEHIVYFDAGAPAKVRTGEPVAYLGRVLFEHGFVDESTLDRSLVEIAKTRELHGEYLVRTGAIDRAALIRGLEAQAVRKLSYLFQLPAGTKFAFYAGINLLHGWGGSELVPLDPLPLIWNAVRIQPDERVVEATLARLGAATLRMHPDSDTSRFGFEPAELAAVNVLRACPQTLATLLACEIAKERAVRLVVYTLLVTRHLDHGGDASPVGLKHAPVQSRMRGALPGSNESVAQVRPDPHVHGSEPASVLGAAHAPSALVTNAHGPVAHGPVAHGPVAHGPVATPDAKASPDADAACGAVHDDARLAPVELSPEMQARRTAILERAHSIDREDYFTMLGVAREADQSTIQAAYLALAKTWHPDRVPAELALLKGEASKVFARMNEAFEVLLDPTRRARYLEVLKGGAGTPEEAEKIQRIIGATGDFQRAQVYYRKRDLANAHEHVKRAYEADPDQADYAALYALVLLGERTSPHDSLSDIGSLLERAIATEPRCERAYFARALLHRRLGQAEAAIADFREVVELNPKNVDAMREVRLYEMRKGRTGHSRGSSSPPERSGTRSKPAEPGTSKGASVFSGIQKLFKR